MEYEPEIVQLITGTHLQHAVPDYVEHGVEALTHLVGVYTGRDFEHVPGGNYGADHDFENEVFALRGYCWCDGDNPDHADGCPPNFECGAFQLRWYKHLGRGMSANGVPTQEQWRDIMRRCIASLQETA
jgi:hypothetical protein